MKRTERESNRDEPEQSGELYQVQITALRDSASQRRVSRFLALLAPRRKEEELYQRLSRLPLTLTRRASSRIAHRLRQRLEPLGATVEISLISAPPEVEPVLSVESSPLPEVVLSPAQEEREDKTPALSLAEERIPFTDLPTSLSLFSILKKALLHYGKHFLLLYSISILPYLLIALMIGVMVVSWGLGSFTAIRTGKIEIFSPAQFLIIHGPLAIAGLLLALLFSILLTQMGMAALIVAVVHTLRGSLISLLEAFARGCHFVFPLLLASLCFLFRCLLTFLPVVVSVGASLVLESSWEISLANIITGVAITLYLLIRTVLQNFLYPFTLVIEELGPLRALQRSRTLMGGLGYFSSLWQNVRLLFLFLCFALISGGISLGLSNLFLLLKKAIPGVEGEGIWPGGSFLEMGILLCSAVLIFLLQHLPVAFMMICFVLFYFDRVQAIDGR